MNLRRRRYATNILSTKRRVASATQLARMVSVLALLSVAAHPASAQVNVLTQHNDNARTGANTNETILTPANVNKTTFGKLFSNAVDGYVYAQPLYYANLTMGAGTAQAGTVHNVFFIATENDSVYAFDADSNGGANANPLWQASLIDSAHGAGSGETPMPNGDVMTTDIVPQIGITGTPVIDPTTNTIYVVAKSTISGTTFFQRLHALDITTGKEKFGGPVALAAQVKGNGNGSVGDLLKFDPMWENNRPGLLLLNGIVYIGFASHGDNGPWHGWLLAYNAATLQQTSVFCTTPNGQGSGIWQGGAGLAADVPDPVNHPFGRMFVTTGNGTYDATTPYANGMDFGDDDLRLDLTNGVFTIQDSFTPSNQAYLSSTDEDLGSGGPVLLPDQTGAHPHELVQVGKLGKIYVVDRDSMGGYSTTSENIVQEITGQLQGGIWGMPAYWNGKIYFWGRNDNLRAFSVTAGKLSAQGTSVGPEENTFSTPSPAVSSDGATNGIVWALEADTFYSSDPAILRAYDATNVATEFYNSSQNSSRDAAPPAVKFTVPTIANGKVYVGGVKKVSVYGLLSGVNTVATPAISPASQSFTGTVTVTITDSTTGATIHYTTDGSTPTPSSTTYTAPITVNTTETVTAIATATGFISSPPASATFTLTTQTLMPTFNPPAGAYATPQSVALTDASPASKIYYTTNGSTPATSVTGATALYSAPIAVGLGTTTINAIAVATGLSPSPMASSTYAINVPPDIDFSLGFSASTSSMTFNGSTGLDDTRLQLTSGLANQAGSAFFNTPLNIQNFTADFTMQLSNPAGDGMTFTILGVAPTALGLSGGGLGYGPAVPGATDPASILKSIAIKFDLFSNAGEGANSTGLYTNGDSPSTVADSIDLTPSGINLHSGTTMAVHLAYDGANSDDDDDRRCQCNVHTHLAGQYTDHGRRRHRIRRIHRRHGRLDFEPEGRNLDIHQQYLADRRRCDTHDQPRSGHVQHVGDGDADRCHPELIDLLHDRRLGADDNVERVHVGVPDCEDLDGECLRHGQRPRRQHRRDRRLHDHQRRLLAQVIVCLADGRAGRPGDLDDHRRAADRRKLRQRGQSELHRRRKRAAAHVLALACVGDAGFPACDFDADRFGSRFCDARSTVVGARVSLRRMGSCSRAISLRAIAQRTVARCGIAQCAIPRRVVAVRSFARSVQNIDCSDA